MRYRVEHKTRYQYETNVSVSHHLLRLTPRTLPYQEVLHHEVDTQPAPALTTTHTDVFGNTVRFMTLDVPHTELTVTALSEVIVSARPKIDPETTTPWETVRDRLANTASREIEASEALYASPLVPCSRSLADYCRPSFPEGAPVLQAGLDLMQRIHRDFQFDPKATTISTPLEQVLQRKRGVCQDFAHLQIGCLRSIGLAARYVSGYLETVPPPGKPRLVGADASHAWIQLWCDRHGWVDLDPTNNLQPAERHITVAWGRDFGDVSPLRGVLVGSGDHRLTVAVDILPQP